MTISIYELHSEIIGKFIEGRMVLAGMMMNKELPSSDGENLKIIEHCSAAKVQKKEMIENKFRVKKNSLSAFR
jgi:hypothetical protein